MIVIRDPETFYFNFDSPKNVDENLKYETKFIVKSNEYFDENKIKKSLNNYCQNISMERIFVNTENSKRNKPHKFVLNLSQRLDLTSLNKHVALQNVPIYLAWKTILKKQ